MALGSFLVFCFYIVLVCVGEEIAFLDGEGFGDLVQIAVRVVPMHFE
jgi:hypothetical protein